MNENNYFVGIFNNSNNFLRFVGIVDIQDTNNKRKKEWKHTCGGLLREDGFGFIEFFFFFYGHINKEQNRILAIKMSIRRMNSSIIEGEQATNEESKRNIYNYEYSITIL